ncbi:MAG: hypothetical protein WD071_16780 [Pseudohongiella sp.]|uniref:hypothetical protein n=1 Tax=Pseudohongiella sp. TaxID=1979412 RepID=UPI0034A08731
MKLRLTIQKEIDSVLDSTCFSSDDFIRYFGDDDIDDLIRITFLHNQTYYFTANRALHIYRIEMSPGEITANKTMLVDSLDEVFRTIPRWTSEVRSELKAEKDLNREVNELRELISEQLGEQTKDEEFTVEEINALREKFSRLEEKVRKLEEDQIITSTQFREFKDGIERVSEDIEYYPKETWLRTAPNKIVKLVVSIGKSKEGRKVLADGARKLLGLD